MPEIHIEEYYIKEITDKIISFLKKNNIDKVELNFFSLEADDEIKKTMTLDKLKEKMVEMYEFDDGHFYFNLDHLSCRFEFDGGSFIIKFPEEMKDEMKVFNENK